MNAKIFSVAYLVCLSRRSTCDDNYVTVLNPYFHFPSGSGEGIYAALALGVGDLPDYAVVYMSYFFEAYHSMPFNETSFEYPPLVSDSSRVFKSFTRKRLYQYFEDKISQYGYPGKMCLLRAICESSAHTMVHINGVLGDLLHLIFTPSTTLIESDDAFWKDYIKSEEDGFHKENCKNYKECEVSMLDIMGFVK